MVFRVLIQLITVIYHHIKLFHTERLLEIYRSLMCLTLDRIVACEWNRLNAADSITNIIIFSINLRKTFSDWANYTKDCRHRLKWHVTNLIPQTIKHCHQAGLEHRNRATRCPTTKLQIGRHESIWTIVSGKANLILFTFVNEELHNSTVMREPPPP